MNTLLLENSLSLPALSTGIFGLPKERAAGIILNAMHGYFKTKSNSGIKIVRLMLFDTPTLAAFQKPWHDYFNA
jgi:O-acetyl-ADP-ribose deacetylase (regulator of RNase III)